MLTKQQKDELIQKGFGYVPVVYAKSHNKEKIELALDYLEFCWKVVIINTHDVEIGYNQFSDKIRAAAKERGLDVIIVTRPGNSWIHEGDLHCFTGQFTVK